MNTNLGYGKKTLTSASVLLANGGDSLNYGYVDNLIEDVVEGSSESGTSSNPGESVQPTVSLIAELNNFYAPATYYNQSDMAFCKLYAGSLYKPARIDFKVYTDRSEGSSDTNSYLYSVSEYTLYINKAAKSCGYNYNCRLYSTSYRPFRYITLYRPVNNADGYILCIRFRDAWNYTNASYKRNVKVEITNYEDCSIEMLSNMPAVGTINNYDYYNATDGTGAKVYYEGVHNIDINAAWYHSGDQNNYDRLYLGNLRPRTNSTNRLHQYSVCGRDVNGYWIPLSVVGTSHTTSLVATNASTKRVYTTTGFDWQKGLFYHGAGSNVAVNSAGATGTLYSMISNIDFRYSDNTIPIQYCTACNFGHIDGLPIYLRGVIKDDGLFYLRPFAAEKCIVEGYYYNGKFYYDTAHKTYCNGLNTSFVYKDNVSGDLYKCTATGSGGTFVKINSLSEGPAASYEKCWTQTIPTSKEYDSEGNQYVYWNIGDSYYNSTYPYSEYQVCLQEHNPMYWYNNGFKPYGQ